MICRPRIIFEAVDNEILILLLMIFWVRELLLLADAFGIKKAHNSCI